MTRKYTYLTDEQKLDVIDLYKNGWTCRKLATKYNIDKSAISRLLKNNNIPVEYDREGKARLYTINHDAFRDFTEQSAYWGGFLYADGYIHKTRPIIVVALKSSDREHVEKFRKFIETNKPIRTYEHKLNGKIFMSCGNEIVSKDIVEDVKKYGVGRPRNPLSINELPNEYFPHWLRGFIDGDGSISKTKPRISIVGDKKLLRIIDDRLIELLGIIHGSIFKHTVSHVYYLEYYTRDKTKKILDYIYKDATIWLNRKRPT